MDAVTVDCNVCAAVYIVVCGAGTVDCHFCAAVYIVVYGNNTMVHGMVSGMCCG